MNIAINVSPLQTGHKVRGTGFYLVNLKNALLKYFPERKFTFFTGKINESVDLVHYPYFDPFFLSLPLRKNYPLIVTVHDLTPIVFPKHFPIGIKGRLKWYMQKIALKSADAVITDSEASKKDIVRYTDIPGIKVHVVYLAAGEEFKKVESEWENDERL